MKQKNKNSKWIETLSRNKVLLVVKILLIFLLMYLVYYFLFVATKKAADISDLESNLTNTSSSNEVKELVDNKNIDTDNDGLLDWEEELYQTDKNSSDTDNDGFSDHQEILFGSDPLVFGNTVSENIDIEILVKEDGIITQEKPAMIDNNQEIVKAVIPENNQSQNQGNDAEEAKNKIFKSDINKLALAATFLEDVSGDEKFLLSYDSLVTQKSSSEDREYLLEISKKLSAQAKAYGYISIESPEIQKYQNNLILDFKNIAVSLEDMVSNYAQSLEEETDFMQALMDYSNSVNKIGKNLVSVHYFVVENNINFSSSEPGSFFEFSF